MMKTKIIYIRLDLSISESGIIVKIIIRTKRKIIITYIILNLKDLVLETAKEYFYYV